jgi:hypothetical protein
MPLLKIVDEDGVTLSDIGSIEESDLRQLISVATNLDLPCLRFVDTTGDTIFNEKQMYQIKEEIRRLREYKGVSQPLLDVIERGIDEALKDVFHYLKFWGN